jgi:hypothetical protein
MVNPSEQRSDYMGTTEHIPPSEYRQAERKARAYIRRNYPAYKDRIASIGGSPRGKFLTVYIVLGPHDMHKVYVPTGRAA